VLRAGMSTDTAAGDSTPAVKNVGHNWELTVHFGKQFELVTDRRLEVPRPNARTLRTPKPTVGSLAYDDIINSSRAVRHETPRS
jgi:hypothetical protein